MKIQYNNYTDSYRLLAGDYLWLNSTFYSCWQNKTKQNIGFTNSWGWAIRILTEWSTIKRGPYAMITLKRYALSLSVHPMISSYFAKTKLLEKIKIWSVCKNSFFRSFFVPVQKPNSLLYGSVISAYCFTVRTALGIKTY